MWSDLNFSRWVRSFPTSLYSPLRITNMRAATLACDRRYHSIFHTGRQLEFDMSPVRVVLAHHWLCRTKTQRIAR